jgi:hypothetical protein
MRSSISGTLLARLARAFPPAPPAYAFYSRAFRPQAVRDTHPKLIIHNDSQRRGTGRETKSYGLTVHEEWRPEPGASGSRLDICLCHVRGDFFTPNCSSMRRDATIAHLELQLLSRRSRLSLVDVPVDMSPPTLSDASQGDGHHSSVAKRRDTPRSPS